MKEEMPLFTTPVRVGRKPCSLSSQPRMLEMVASSVTRCAGTRALGIVRPTSGILKNFFEVRDHGKPLRVAYSDGTAKITG